ncbi:fibronectin type III domain-containing protein [Flavobacterium sp. GN10]|uniref:Fibronectin type III domain-containing protein n=1 Tax=Flavobacterium tagetis TaxID=2801336 RepID=A0ABS1KJP3_9FLAO|nr:fibronectin type III domain-containing protein [Flavobacterium tagetis]MBL0738426.1 fibronectin type III domain-containing protein [Flavobacterium tagetis]
MKNLFNNIYFVVLFLFFNAVGYAQLYPVQLTPVFNSPYSVKISDYATSMDTKMQLLINPTDISISQRRVRLKLYIHGNGLNIQTSDYAQEQRPIYINGGELQTLTNVDIASLFRLENLQGITPAQYANPLPEGMYNFCFEMYDFVTNQKISQKSCANLYLILNDPPILNTPQKNEQIAATEFPNILFTWTPRQINATNVSYKFELKQLLDPTLDPQIGFQMSPTLYEETLFGTAVLYNLSMPILTPGLRYAWRVRAISTTGLSENSVFKNDGYSEIFSFKYTASCAAPTFLLSESQTSKSVKITWEGIPEHTRYQVQYKKQGVRNAQWFSSNSLNRQSLITNLEPGVTYEFRVGSSCDPAEDGIQSFTYSNTSTFTTPTETSGVPAYNCGIVPQINIQNQKPLTNLIQSETFKAGDFPVTILELQGENSPYSGRGYIVVPYLGDTKIAVEFNSIVINTDYQLISGIVETSYNPDWKNVVDGKPDPLIEEIFGPQTGNEEVAEAITEDPSENNTESEDVAESTNYDQDVDKNKDSNVTEENTTASNGQNPNEGTNIINEATSSNSNSGTEKSDNASSGKGYYIEYRNKKYYNGDKINIPFNRNGLISNRFKMKEFEKDTNVKYELSYESEKGVRFENVEGNNYLKKTESEKEANFEFSFDNTLKYQLKSVADNDKKTSLSNEINLIVKPFQLKYLRAVDASNSKRVANESEILYYVDKSVVLTDSKKTKFSVGFNIPINEVPQNDIKWRFNDGYDKNKDGVDSFEVYINDDKKNVLVTAISGNPTEGKKNVSVKWINEDRIKHQVVPTYIQNTAEKIFNNLTKLDTILKKAGINKVLEIKPKISVSGSQFNDIDKLSRHYKVIQEGEINASVEAKATFKAPPPYSGKVEIPFTDIKVVDYGFYLAVKVSLGIQGKIRNEKRDDVLEFENVENSICIKGSGGIEPGLKLELLPGNEVVSATGKAYGKAELTATGCYVIGKGFKPTVALSPLVAGANINVKSGGISIFDYSFEKTLSEKIKFYGE